MSSLKVIVEEDGNPKPKDDPDYWKRNIEARDRLDLTCLPSFLASVLYPYEVYNRDRIAALKKEFPGLITRIHTAAARKGALVVPDEVEA